jgi:hypothetical protein
LNGTQGRGEFFFQKIWRKGVVIFKQALNFGQITKHVWSCLEC